MRKLRVPRTVLACGKYRSLCCAERLSRRPGMLARGKQTPWKQDGQAPRRQSKAGNTILTSPVVQNCEPVQVVAQPVHVLVLAESGD
jgi:hypothetical protein